jgi:PEGA domain
VNKIEPQPMSFMPKNFLSAVVLLAVPLTAQMPQAGTLVVRSDPPGATVSINGKIVPKALTNTAIVVSPGTYTVLIEKPPLRCQQKVSVAAGQTATVQCPQPSGR